MTNLPKNAFAPDIQGMHFNAISYICLASHIAFMLYVKTPPPRARYPEPYYPCHAHLYVSSIFHRFSHTNFEADVTWKAWRTYHITSSADSRPWGQGDYVRFNYEWSIHLGGYNMAINNALKQIGYAIGSMTIGQGSDAKMPSRYLMDVNVWTVIIWLGCTVCLIGFCHSDQNHHIKTIVYFIEMIFYGS